MTKPGSERRKYLRIETPLSIRVIDKNNVVHEAKTKDISPLGIRVGLLKNTVNIKDEVELKIELPKPMGPVHARAKVVWKKDVPGNGKPAIDIGCEIIKIEEDNKNTFLKYFCDLLYKQSK